LAIIDLAAIQTLVDRRYREVRDQVYASTEDQIGMFYDIQSSTSFEERISSIGENPTWDEFQGTIPYVRWYEQYNTVATHREYAQGMRYERTALEDDLTNILRGDYYAKMVRSGIITRQQHAARLWNFAATNDLTFYTRSEGVPIASNSHTTATPGVSTATGFDNLTTAALSPTAYRAARIQMRRFANDQGHIMNTIGDGLVVPIDLEPRAEEILMSSQSPDNANNAVNPERGTATVMVSIYWNDTNDWALVNKMMMKDNCIWFDRRKPDFRSIMDFDTEQLKVAGSGRWSTALVDWRWLMFASVS
jgi:phage major head subunit gpT-like protein